MDNGSKVNGRSKIHRIPLKIRNGNEIGPLSIRFGTNATSPGKIEIVKYKFYQKNKLLNFEREEVLENAETTTLVNKIKLHL